METIHDPVRLIRSIAWRFFAGYWDMDELYSAGNLGYAIALAKQHEVRGPFVNFAYGVIYRQMQMAMRRQDKRHEVPIGDQDFAGHVGIDHLEQARKRLLERTIKTLPLEEQVVLAERRESYGTSRRGHIVVDFGRGVSEARARHRHNLAIQHLRSRLVA